VRFRTSLSYLCAIALFTASALAVARAQQQAKGANSDLAFDPLSQVTKDFPQSITVNETKRTVEFCPDNTCDAFVASSAISVSTLKDAAYLYIYFFSGYFGLPKWRNLPESRATAERVLSKPEYRNCKRDMNVDIARCVLLGLGQKGSIKLEFIRYDEGSRNVVPEDLVKELTEKARH
jgi:hypothetical protein